MWCIQFLNGPLKGQSIEIKDQDILGRSKQIAICVDHGSVSKQHCLFYFKGNQLHIKDLSSSNGSFVDGKQISKAQLKVGSCLNFHDLQAVITDTDQKFNWDKKTIKKNPESNKLNSIKALLKDKIQKVALPGVYKLPELLELHYVFGVFLVAFVLIMTSLSYIPLGTLLKTSIQKESQNRAMGIAKHLASLNKVYLQKGPKAAISTSVALQESGVDKAFIISAENNRIIAPISEQGQFPPEDINDLFVGINKNTEYFKQLNSSTIVAIKPIKFLNHSAELKTLAYSVVVYNMASLSFSDKRALSLFVQTVFIGLLIGSILFFFLFHIIKYIFDELNQQTQKAMNKGQYSVSIPYRFVALQKLIDQINGLLNRVALLKNKEEDSSKSAEPIYDKLNEINTWLQFIQYPSLIVEYNNQKIISTNESANKLFEENLLHQDIENLSDQSLKLNLQDLLQRAKNEDKPVGFIDLQDYTYNIELQNLFGLKSVDYALLVFSPKE